MSPPSKDPDPSTSYGKLLGTAVVASALGIIVARNFMETEKKVKTPVRTDFGVGDPPFVRSMSQLLGPPLLEGNTVKILNNGAEIFPAMLKAIAEARRSVTFENFVFSEGRVSSRFADALSERARAGVKVHFLQDAIGCNCLTGEAMSKMKDAGVELEIFRYAKLSEINHRTHRKLLVIDGQWGFTGGAGISDEWDGNADAPDHWRDTQYCLEGPAVAQMQQAFMDNWMQTRAEVLHGDDYFPELKPRGDLDCQVFKSSSSEGGESARVMWLLSLAAARKSIRIANAYFVPDDLMIQTMVEALQRGVTIEIIAPGTCTDQPTVRVVGRSRWGPLLENGARIYEYQPCRFHCKYMIVDDCWVSVGSANMDNRSLRLNAEANLNVHDHQFALLHQETFEEDKAKTREITLREWQQRPMSEKAKGFLASVFRSQM